MKIVMRDGRVFQGTAIQIVRDMKSIAFGVDRQSLSEYIDWVAAQALRLEGVDVCIAGNTDEAKAGALLAELIRTGLADKV